MGQAGTRGGHALWHEVVTVVLPSRLIKREMLAGSQAEEGTEAVETDTCLRPGPSGHSFRPLAIVHRLCVQAVYMELPRSAWSSHGWESRPAGTLPLWVFPSGVFAANCISAFGSPFHLPGSCPSKPLVP